MQTGPRLVLRTHYQACRPGLYSVLLQYCTSRSESATEDAVAARLLNAGLKQTPLNRESAKFAVSMAKAYGFLTRNIFWDTRGLALGLVLCDRAREQPDDYLILEPEEQILYLMYHLEADGAVIIGLCRALEERGKLTRVELRETPLIDDIFMQVWDDYRQRAHDLRMQVALRENMAKLKHRPYTPKTRTHKALAHLEPLVDIGLLRRIGKGKGEVAYEPNTIAGITLVTHLLNELPDIEALETIIAKQGLLPTVGRVLQYTRGNEDPPETLFRAAIVKAYSGAVMEPTLLAPISVISDVAGVRILFEHGFVPGPQQVQDCLVRLKEEFPRDVSFHVDRVGQTSFVVLRGVGKAG